MAATENDSRKWLARAMELARKAQTEDEVPVGALVVHEGKIVGEAYNRREQDQNPVAHAEILALQEAAKKLGSWRLVDCTLVVTLEPCPMCLAACQQARVEKLVYGTPDTKGGALSLNYPLHADSRLNHRFTVEHVESVECSDILKSFFASKRRGKS
jgi:tRNA(adenine34) deaminase